MVPYNPKLLQMFQGHINVEKTDQSNSIKYLFKYITKGNDRVIAALKKKTTPNITNDSQDEVSQYINCRYLTPCEGAWRIFGFPIQHIFPPVQRLPYHLPNQQPVIFFTDESVPSLLEKPRAKESIFLSWMEINQHDEDARKLK